MMSGDRNVPEKGERELIRRIRAACATDLPAALRARLGDDMAPLPVPRSGSAEAVGVGTPELLWTTDMLMDGVDFRSDQHDWYAIGRKAMAVNLSDCAAMAVRPVAALCAVALCDRLTMADAERLHAGVREMGRAFDCPLVGGDTNSWPQPTVISVTVAAVALPDAAPVTRAGARPGDVICVTGRLGGSILGRHMTFTPRVAESHRIARVMRPTAMIDISDGLAIDLWHLCDESGCGALLDEHALAEIIHADACELAARSGRTPLEHALHDGEDFELLVTLPERNALRCADAGLVAIGSISREPGVHIRQSDGALAPLDRCGWEHFR